MEQWNNLPDSLKEVDSLKKFKVLLKKWLKDRDTDDGNYEEDIDDPMVDNLQD